MKRKTAASETSAVSEEETSLRVERVVGLLQSKVISNLGFQRVPKGRAQDSGAESEVRVVQGGAEETDSYVK